MYTRLICLLFCGYVLALLAVAGELPGGWESRDAGVRSLLVSVSFADDQVGWACGIRAITRTDNGGRAWRAQWNKGGADSYWFNNVVALSPRVALVSGFPYGRQGSGVLLRTEDGGATWTSVQAGSPDASYSSLAFTPDRSIGYVISTRDGLLTTRDGGVTWARVKLPSSPTRVWLATRCNIALPDNKTVIVGGDGALVRSDDAGATWKTLPLPAEVKNPHRQFANVAFPTPQHGWISLLGGDTLETLDGGATWQASTAPGLPFFQNAKTGWALDRYAVSRTVDGGVTWTDTAKIGGGNDGLMALACTTRRAVIVGGTEGTGTAFIADRLLPGVTEVTPPTGVVPVTFTMPKAGYATIQILNAKGEVVQDVAAGKYFTAGKQTVWWDLTTLDDYWPPFAKSAPFLYQPPATARPLAEPGAYRWRGLWHAGLSLEYKHSYYPYKSSGLAWITPDHTGGWLGDHAPPQDVVRAGDTMWVGTFCESGEAILEADLSMKKIWGSNRIHLACPKVMAVDGDFIYYLEEGGWLGAAGQRVTLIQLHRATKTAVRLFSIGQDEQRAPADDLRNVAGLVVRGNRAYITDREQYAVVVCDLTANLAKRDEKLHVLDNISLLHPGRLRPYDDTHLAAISGTRVVLIDIGTQAVRPVVTKLTNPQGLGVDAAGNFYVGEMDPVHQVKVFDRTGKLLRTIGKPGKHRVGAFDPDNLESPSGIDVDARGNVWVTEFSEAVKRTSLWDAQGHCINQVIGPTAYGGAGEIDPEDENHFFYYGQEFRRDAKTGALRLVNLFWRYDDPRYDRFVETRPHNFGGPAPSYPFRRDGKLFFSMWGGYGMGEVTTLFVYETDQVRPVAAAGRIPDWLRARLQIAPEQQIFAWTDGNDDGRVQADELQTGTLQAGGAVWGVRMNRNFEVAFSTVAGDVGVAFFRVARLNAKGYPVYTLPTEYKMVPGLQANDPNQIQGVFADQQGNAIVNSPYLFSMRPDGSLNWRMKNRWPGLHAGLNTSANGTEAGVLIAPIRFYGAGVVNPEVGEVFCLGSNYGATELITADGLYIGRAFQDSRRADAWAFTAPPTPAQLNTVSLGQEHFGGTFQRVQGADGQAHFQYVVAGGGPSCSVVELHGLEQVQRFPGSTLTVTPQQRLQAEQLYQQRQAETKEAKSYTIPRVTLVAVDGKATEWPKERIDGFALAYNDEYLYLCYEGKDDRAVFQNAATADTFQDAFKRGDVVDLMLETKGGLPATRADAGEGDIRLSFTLVDGKPAAILYDYVAPGTPKYARSPFSSPWRTVYVDRVLLLDTARVAVTRGKDSFTLEAAVPLAALHLDPAVTPVIHGDVGLVVSDQTGTRTIDRRYWSNKNTLIVSDLPSEVRLQPNLWGTFSFGK